MRKFTVALFLLLAAVPTRAENLLTNGDFANGFAGWTIKNDGPGLGGQAEVLSALGNITPSASPQFALVSTGPAALRGSITKTIGSLSQPFVVPTDQEVQITFTYGLVTSLFTGGDNAYVDRFWIRIVDSNQGSQDLIVARTSAVGFLTVDGSLITSPAGCNFAEYTPLTPFSTSLTLTAGTYKIEFRAQNGINSLFDSGILVENVQVNTTAPALSVGGKL
ncbi:MAG: hypothetical protein ABI693_34830 [Bryobacteraceae bacterium]